MHQLSVMGRSDRLDHSAQSAALSEHHWQWLCHAHGSSPLSLERLLGRSVASPQHQAGPGPGALLVGFDEDCDWTGPRRRIRSSCAGVFLRLGRSGWLINLADSSHAVASWVTVGDIMSGTVVASSPWFLQRG